MKTIVLLGTLLATLASASPGSGRTTSVPEARFPARVATIDGQDLDVAKLAAQNTLVVVTLKATWCPVCRHQLERIRDKLPEIEGCGVTFLVLAPGPRRALKEIQKQVGFPYPFVEDVDLRIAKRLRLQMSEKEIFPSILILRQDLSVGWMQRGRNARRYGDAALLATVNCGDWI